MKTKKKTYCKPQAECTEITLESVLCTSVLYAFPNETFSNKESFGFIDEVEW